MARRALFPLVMLLGVCPAAFATPPTLFSQPAYQSPTRSDPGDLLILPGDGFSASDTVVYQAISNTTQPLTPPVTIPSQSSASAGTATLVSSVDAPHSLTVLLPAVMQTDQSYAIWVQDAAGEWSNGIEINDARPLWITPDSAYVTQNTANLPRYLKVVGRNLQPAPGSTTQVMLTGPGTYTLTASDDDYPTNAIDRYAAKVTLPTGMPAGTYTVQVSRDGISWIGVANGQTLTVNPDPSTPASFPVGNYGGCVATDSTDDTPCIIQAIAAAHAAGGGSVTFGPGTWHMSNSSQAGVNGYGVLVPAGVNLVGAGASSTTVVRDTTWYTGIPNFTLEGNTLVQGITFQDAQEYNLTFAGRMMLELGTLPTDVQSFNTPSAVSHVIITQNVFNKAYVGIQDRGMPIDHLFLTNNDFGAYYTGLYLDQTHVFSDSVIANNTFEPGSYIDTSQRNGTIASQLSAGQRVDFSNNTANGTSTQYLYHPATDAKGFRAAFFWALHGNQDQVLVAQNTATCPGDKDGDGEGLGFDGNGDSTATGTAEAVESATSNTVVIAGPLLTLTGSTAYNELWVQISQGTGVGQVRPVVAYSDPTASTVTLTVSPAWDVIPGTNSLVLTGKEYWQFYAVDNLIDQRQTPTGCTKGNVTSPSGGVITLWTRSADSAIEGNQLYDTSGIEYAMGYDIQSTQYGTSPGSAFQSLLDIRNNIVDGEYNWGASCSWSGIRGWYGASPDATVFPMESYGVSISHNTVTQADDLRGGAIALTASWYAGPASTPPQLADNTLIYLNSINNISNPASASDSTYANCTASYPRIGIKFDDSTAWHSVLYANSCTNVAQNLSDRGTATARVCSTGSVPTGSCECPAGGD